MLTAYQCATGAYMTEDGELLCESCFESEDVFAKPVSNYALDEEQTFYAEGYIWGDRSDADEDPEGVDPEEYHEQCAPPLDDVNGHELVEAYHYHPDAEREPDRIAYTGDA